MWGKRDPTVVHLAKIWQKRADVEPYTVMKSVSGFFPLWSGFGVSQEQGRQTLLPRVLREL